MVGQDQAAFESAEVALEANALPEMDKEEDDALSEHEDTPQQTQCCYVSVSPCTTLCFHMFETLASQVAHPSSQSQSL